MTVTFDAAGPSSAGTSFTTGPGTWTQVNNGNGILVGVTTFTGATNVVTGVHYGPLGTAADPALSFLGFIQSGTGGAGGVALYGLVGATCPTGSNTVSVTVSDTGNHQAGSVSVAGAASLGTPVTATANGVTSVSAAVTGTTAGGLVVSVVCQGSNSALAATAPNINRVQKLGTNTSGSDNIALGTDPSTGATVTPVWTCAASDFWGMVAVEVLPASADSALAWQYDLPPEQEDDGIDDGVPEWPPWFTDAGVPQAAPPQVFIHPQSVRAKYLPGPMLARRASQARSSSGPAPVTRPPWVRAPRTRTRSAPAQLPSVNVAAPPPSPPESPPPVPAARRGGFLGRPRHEAASAPLPPVAVPPPYPPGSVRPVRRWPLRRYASAPRAGSGPVRLVPPAGARRVPEARVRRPGAAGPPVPPPVPPAGVSLSTSRRRLWPPRPDRGSATILPAPPPVVPPQVSPVTARRRVWLPRLLRGSAAGPVPPPPASPPPPSLPPAALRRRAGLPRGDRGSATVPVPPPPAGPPPVSWVPQAVRAPRRLMARARRPAAPPVPARSPRTGAVSPRRPARVVMWPRTRAAAPVPAQVVIPPAHYVPPAPRWRRLWRFLRRQPGITVPPGAPPPPPPPPPAVSAAGTAAGVPHGAWAAGAPHGAGLGAGVPGGRWQTRGVSGTTAGAGPPHGSWSAASPHG